MGYQCIFKIHEEAERQYQRVSERQQPDYALMERIAKFTQLKFWTLCKESAALNTLVEGSYARWADYDQHFRKQWDTLFASESYENFVQSTPDFTNKSVLSVRYISYTSQKMSFCTTFTKMSKPLGVMT
jgi:hypothetical protein